MPAKGQTGSEFLPGKHSAAGTLSGAAGEPSVEINCASYEIRTNSAVFHDTVRVRQYAGESTQGTMSCDTLTASFSGTNELQNIVAENHVILEHETNRFTADRAVFESAAGLLDLTGNPAWRSGSREGSGNTIKVEPEKEEMKVIGDAVMRANGLAKSNHPRTGSEREKSIGNGYPGEISVLQKNWHDVDDGCCQCGKSRGNVWLSQHHANRDFGEPS